MSTATPPADEPPFDRRLFPTAGVARLFVEALLDLALLAPRVLFAAALAAARRREIIALVRTKGRHAA
ncbi:MAG: hypothetical protein EXS13_00720 [Planctomycetes bacterium]|nr:hypothetical protein [Planctomycetota bacterium]